MPIPPITLYVSVAVLDADRRRLLLVRELKEVNRGKWNLPGGHLEPLETLAAGAVREAREETHLSVKLDAVLGVYTHLRPHLHGVRWVFISTSFEGTPAAGDGISELRWAGFDEIDAMPDSQLVHPWAMRRFTADLRAGVRFPPSVISENVQLGP